MLPNTAYQVYFNRVRVIMDEFKAQSDELLKSYLEKRKKSKSYGIDSIKAAGSNEINKLKKSNLNTKPSLNKTKKQFENENDDKAIAKSLNLMKNSDHDDIIILDVMKKAELKKSLIDDDVIFIFDSKKKIESDANDVMILDVVKKDRLQKSDDDDVICFFDSKRKIDSDDDNAICLNLKKKNNKN